MADAGLSIITRVRDTPPSRTMTIRGSLPPRRLRLQSYLGVLLTLYNVLVYSLCVTDIQPWPISGSTRRSRQYGSMVIIKSRSVVSNTAIEARKSGLQHVHDNALVQCSSRLQILSDAYFPCILYAESHCCYSSRLVRGIIAFITTSPSRERHILRIR